MGHYHEDGNECDDSNCVPRDCMEVKKIAKNPRDFLLDGKPQYYDDPAGKTEE